MHTGSGLGRKAATQVCEPEKLTFAYFALVSLTSVQQIQKVDGPWNFWKPLTADYVATGVFFPPEKWPPSFGKPLTCGYVAAGVFFQQNGPRLLEAPNL